MSPASMAFDATGNMIEYYSIREMPAASYVVGTPARRRVVVANFSSAHPFRLDNGVELPACTRERADSLKAVPCHSIRRRADGLADAYVGFGSTDAIRKAYDACHALWEGGGVDIIITPLITLDLFVSDRGFDAVVNSPFRTIVRVEAEARDPNGRGRHDVFGLPRRGGR